jgi:hypothetical protein
MVIILAGSLAALATETAMPGGWVGVIALFLVAAVFAIFVGLLAQAWVASVQVRSFSRRPDADEALKQLFEVYGWRARLGCKLFRVPLPLGFQERTTQNRLS